MSVSVSGRPPGRSGPPPRSTTRRSRTFWPPPRVSPAASSPRTPAISPNNSTSVFQGPCRCSTTTPGGSGGYAAAAPAARPNPRSGRSSSSPRPPPRRWSAASSPPPSTGSWPNPPIDPGRLPADASSVYGPAAAIDALMARGARKEGQFIRDPQGPHRRGHLNALDVPPHRRADPVELARGDRARTSLEQVRQLQYATFLEHFGNMSKTPESLRPPHPKPVFHARFQQRRGERTAQVVGYVLGSTYTSSRRAIARNAARLIDYIWCPQGSAQARDRPRSSCCGKIWSAACEPRFAPGRRWATSRAIATTAAMPPHPLRTARLPGRRAPVRLPYRCTDRNQMSTATNYLNTPTADLDELRAHFAPVFAKIADGNLERERDRVFPTNRSRC